MKIWSLFLIFASLLLPVGASAALVAGDVSGEIQLIVENGVAVAHFYTEAFYSEKVLIAALVSYDNGRLDKIETREMKLESGFPCAASVRLEVSYSVVKAFLWDIDSLFPIAFRDNQAQNGWDYADIYVSPLGSDANNGSATTPFATVQRAATAARALNVNRDIIVSIAGGNYPITSPIKFTASDSGRNGNKIIYKGAPNLSTVIDGGGAVTGFQPVAGKSWWEADLVGEDYIYEFYINGHRAKAASSEYKYQPIEIYNDPQTPESADGFAFDNLPLDFEDCGGMLMSNSYEWVYNLVPVSKFFFEGGKKIATGKQPYAAWYKEFLKPEFPVYFINHISLLDSPGEFYFDKNSSKIYYYPFPNEDMTGAVGHIPVSEGLITVNGGNLNNKASNITFENLSFKHGQWKRTWEKGFSVNQAETYIETPELFSGNNWIKAWQFVIPAQVQVSFADKIDIKNSRFENLSAGAVGFTDGVINSSISGCEFYDIGGAAVTIGRGSHIWYSGEGINANNICKNISVSNNYIRETGQLYQSSAAVTAYYVNNCSITHNDIADVPYTGISFGWGWGNDEPQCRDNTVSYNKITNVMRSMWDGSHIYTLSDMPNTVIEYNYMDRTDSNCSGGGYYPDEGSKNITVRGNVTENARSWNVDWGRRDIAYQNNYVGYLKTKITNGSGYNEANAAQLAGFTEFSAHTTEISEIIENAGLSENYKYIAQKSRPKAKNIFDSNLEWYLGDDCVTVHAGEMLMEGGDGVAYHDNDNWNHFDGLGTGPDWGGRRLGIGYAGAGEWVTYKITVPRSGVYDLYSRTATDAASGCSVYINGIKTADNVPLKIKTTGNIWADCQNTYLCAVSLEADIEYLVKYEFNYGYWNFDSLIFKPRPETTLIAEESFDYAISAQGTPFGDYPSVGQSDVNGGTGWAGKWSKASPLSGGFPTVFPSGNGQIPGFWAWSGNEYHSQTVAFSFSNNQLYRALSQPINTNIDHIIRLKYDIMSQYVGRNGFTLGNIFIGNAEYGASAMRSAIGINNSYIFGKTPLNTGNSNWYTYMAELDIKADGRDTIRVKVFPYKSGEPVGWDAQTAFEMGDTPITYAGFEVAASSYFGNLKITETSD